MSEKHMVHPSFEHGAWSLEAVRPGGFQLGYTFGSVQLATPDDGTDLLTPDGLRDLRTAITAALGDGAIVVTPGRLRAALMQAWDAGECCMGVGVDPEPILAGEGGPDVDRIIAALTAPGGGGVSEDEAPTVREAVDVIMAQAETITAAEQALLDLLARIAALEAERDAARAEAGRLRGLLGRARVAVVCLSEWSAPGAQVGVELLAAIDAALAGSGEQRP